VRSINDKNAQLQKQLDNLVREGNCFSRAADLNKKGSIKTSFFSSILPFAWWPPSGQRDQLAEREINW